MKLGEANREDFKQSVHSPASDSGDGQVVSDSSSVFSNHQACLRALLLAEQMRCRGMDYDAPAIYNLFSKTGDVFPRAARFAGLSAIDTGDLELFDRVRADLVAFAAREPCRARENLVALLELEFRLRLRIVVDLPDWLSRLDVVHSTYANVFNLTLLCVAQLLVTRRFSEALAVCHSLCLDKPSHFKDGFWERDVWLRLAAAVCCRELHRFDDMTCWGRQAAALAAENHCIQPYFEFISWPRDPLLRELSAVAPDIAADVLKKEHAVFVNMIHVRNHLTGGVVADRLSRRQMFIVSHINDGRSYNEIAEMQGVSLGRLRNCCMATYRILKIHRRGELRGRVL